MRRLTNVLLIMGLGTAIGLVPGAGASAGVAHNVDPEAKSASVTIDESLPSATGKGSYVTVTAGTHQAAAGVAMAEGVGVQARSAGDGYAAAAPGACASWFEVWAGFGSGEQCVNAKGCVVSGVTGVPDGCQDR